MPLHVIDGKRLLVLRGTPFEMGQEHGRLLRDEIHVAIQEYLADSLKIFDVPRDYLQSEAQHLAALVPPPYLEELEGLASGSGVSVKDLLALNCLVDLDNVYTQSAMHCCNFVVGPPVTEGDLLVHGRNLDFPHRGIIQMVAAIIVRVPTDGNKLPTLSVTWAGFVGTLTGYNAARLTAAEVTSPTRSTTLSGMPIMFLLRNSLEMSDSVQAFTSHVSSLPRMCGYNLAVCDGKSGESIAIELTPSSCQTRGPRDGILVVDNPRLCLHSNESPLTYPEGAFRHARVMQFLHDNRGTMNLPLVRQLLSDRYDLAKGVDSGRGYFCICNEHTVQSVIFLPREDRMLISNDSVPAPKGSYLGVFPSQYW